jgi:hypothetical protein
MVNEGQIIFISKHRWFTKNCPTKRAPDVWDSAAFSSIFLASSFSCSQAESTPAHTQVTPAVSPLIRTGSSYETIIEAYAWDHPNYFVSACCSYWILPNYAFLGPSYAVLGRRY